MKRHLIGRMLSLSLSVVMVLGILDPLSAEASSGSHSPTGNTYDDCQDFGQYTPYEAYMYKIGGVAAYCIDPYKPTPPKNSYMIDCGTMGTVAIPGGVKMYQAILSTFDCKNCSVSQDGEYAYDDSGRLLNRCQILARTLIQEASVMDQFGEYYLYYDPYNERIIHNTNGREPLMSNGGYYVRYQDTVDAAHLLSAYNYVETDPEPGMSYQAGSLLTEVYQHLNGDDATDVLFLDTELAWSSSENAYVGETYLFNESFQYYINDGNMNRDGITFRYENGMVKIRATQNAVNSYFVNKSYTVPAIYHAEYRVGDYGYSEESPAYLAESCVHLFRASGTGYTYQDMIQARDIQWLDRFNTNAFILTVKEKPAETGAVKIIKSSEDNLVSGIRFLLFNTRRTYDATTNSSGVAEFTDVVPDTYKLQEKGDWTKYIRNEDISVTVKEGQTETIRVDNRLLPGSVKVTKTSEDGKVSGIVFTLSNSSRSYAATTDGSGTATFADVVPGTYTLHENGDWSRYVQVTDKSVTVNPGKTTAVAVTNTLLKGTVVVNKTSSDGNIAGIMFTLTNDKNSYSTVTGTSGTATFSNVEPGTYTLTEKGDWSKYIEVRPISVTVVPGKTTTQNVENIPYGYLKVIKTSDDGVVKGLRFTVKGDNGVEASQITDSSGEALFVIPAGTYTVTEDSSEKYKFFEKTVTVKAGEKNEVRTNAHNYLADAMLGEIEIIKTDSEYEKSGRSLEDAEFSVINRSGRTIKVGGREYADGETVISLRTDSKGNTATGRILPFGTYGILETEAPKGFNLNSKEGSVSVTDYAQTLRYELSDDVIRNNLEFTKIASGTGEELEGRVFRISLLDGNGDIAESHVAVTGHHGIFDSAALLAASDGSNINKNDEALTSEGVIDLTKIDPTAPVWFYGIEGDPKTFRGSFRRGAFVQGKYLFEEFDTDSRYVVIDPFEYEMRSGDGYIHSFVLTDYNPPVISTTLTDENGYKTVRPMEEIRLKDEVVLSGLETGKKYTVSGVLTDRETGKPLLDDKGLEIQAKPVTFTADKAEKELILDYFFNAEHLSGKAAVAFVEVTRKADLSYMPAVTVVTHANLEDEDQTVCFETPEIETTAAGKDGNKIIYGTGKAEITDTVSYRGLIPEKEYELIGRLADKETGEIILNGEGKEYTAGCRFTPKEGDGEVKMVFEIVASGFGRRQLVAFEKLYLNGEVVAVHEDIDDEAQTVTVLTPEIYTNASNGAGGKEIYGGDIATVTDTVTYLNLNPGTTYTLKGVLMDKDSGKPVTDFEGRECTAEKQFTPKEDDGETELKFRFEPWGYSNAQLVVFEKLYLNENLIAAHEDLEDEAQTVTVMNDYFLKTDAATGEPLEGATVKFTDKTTNETKEVVSDKEGRLFYPFRPNHKFTFQEIAAPEGYVLDNSIFSYEVDKYGIPDIDTVIKNRKAGTVILTKRNVLNGEPVEGAELAVYDSGGRLLYTQMTDKFGQIYFDPVDYLGEGAGPVTFKFKETSAPKGFYLNSDTLTFTVGTDGKATGALVMDNVPVGTVAIKKTDQNGAILPGAKLSIYSSSDNKLMGQATTGSTGRVYFTPPQPGSYYFIEDAAPAGYERNTQKHTFTIDASGLVTGTVTLINTKSASASTGDRVNLGRSLIITMLLLASGGGILVYDRKINRKERRGKHEQ